MHLHMEDGVLRKQEVYAHALPPKPVRPAKAPAQPANRKGEALMAEHALTGEACASCLAPIGRIQQQRSLLSSASLTMPDACTY